MSESKVASSQRMQTDIYKNRLTPRYMPLSDISDYIIAQR
jgi:hypothetical protein